MIFQGPSVINWQRGRVESAAVESFDLPAPDRLEPWLRANVHVHGRPEWVFVKLHTHGMQSQDSFLGPALDETFAAMVDVWNQPPFRLHFVTAREAYNIVKAAEAGCAGDAGQYRDFLIPPPANRRLLCSGRYRLRGYGPDRVGLEILEPDPIHIEFAEGTIQSVSSNVRHLDIALDPDLAELRNLRDNPQCVIELRASGPARRGPRPALASCSPS
jgi:hypothetical protein